MATITQRMHAKLTEALKPHRLVIVDDSARHHGHAGAAADGLGETHFNVEIEADAFAGKSRVQRQRLVYDLLTAELKERIHALSLKLKAPGER